MRPNAPWFFTTFTLPTGELPCGVAIADTELAHHVKTVMRLKEGSSLMLVNTPEETVYRCTLQAGDAQSLSVLVEERLTTPTRKTCQVVAAVALIKGQRWDWLLQKLTELGVDTIVPLETQRTVVKIKQAEHKESRWQDIVRHAAQQCERVTLPVIHPVVSLPFWLKAMANDENPNGLKLVASEHETKHTLKSVLNVGELNYCVFVVGPEGGWDASELTMLETAGFQTVSLGERIYRSETAAMVMASVIAYECG